METGSRLGNVWNRLVVDRRNWWLPLAVVMTIGLGSMIFVGTKTYDDAPPIPDFVDAAGRPVATQEAILRGQLAFQRYALMDYGSLFGDGAARGVDFTADALHRTAEAMLAHYAGPPQTENGTAARSAALARAGRDQGEPLRRGEQPRDARARARPWPTRRWCATTRRCSAAKGRRPSIPPATSATRRRSASWPPSSSGAAGSAARSAPAPELQLHAQLALRRAGRQPARRAGHAVERDRRAGPDRCASASCCSSMAATAAWPAGAAAAGRRTLPPWRGSRAGGPARLQRAAYKFFAAAGALFVLQIVAGVLTVHDFIGFTRCLRRGHRPGAAADHHCAAGTSSSPCCGSPPAGSVPRSSCFRHVGERESAGAGETGEPALRHGAGAGGGHAGRRVHGAEEPARRILEPARQPGLGIRRAGPAVADAC
jgi:nitric oxide reductase subunit B